jgi:hypothetical protein
LPTDTGVTLRPVHAQPSNSETAQLPQKQDSCTKIIILPAHTLELLFSCRMVTFPVTMQYALVSLSDTDGVTSLWLESQQLMA